MNLPLVSIVIPVYNGSDYLRQAIDSAIIQTYTNIEIIVVNDGSIDNGATEDIALSYGDKIRYFVKQNGGVASALNFGISKMSGIFFSWLSHDDLYRPEKIEIQVKEAAKYDAKTMVWSDYDIVDKGGVIIDSFSLYDENKKSDSFVVLSTFVHGCSLLIPAALFKDIGLFNEKITTAQDNEMWVRALKANYKLAHLPQKLICSRRHAKQGQVTMSNKNKEETIAFYRWAIGYLGAELLPNCNELAAIIAKKDVDIEL
jgi:glycosyltransferase involved in cell wall biosynthesis